MSELKVRPKRHLRHEFYSLLAVMVLPLVIAAAFPFKAIGFRAGSVTGRGKAPVEASCAFVRLGAAEEHAALVASRSSWRVGTAAIRGLRTDLANGKLPEDVLSPVAPDRIWPAASVEIVSHGALLLPPSHAAPEPKAIPAEPVSRETTFPRNELLKIK